MRATSWSAGGQLEQPSEVNNSTTANPVAGLVRDSTEDGAEWRKALAARKAMVRPPARTVILREFFMEGCFYQRYEGNGFRDSEQPIKGKKGQICYIYSNQKSSFMIALYIILGLIVLFLVVAAFVGTGWSFEKNILIQAPRSNVWGHVNSLGAINSWNPWLDRDPGVSQSITGIDGTPGA